METEPTPSNNEPLILGENDALLNATIYAENRAIALSMAQQATRSICIFSRSLDGQLYDNSPFIDAISRLARLNNHSYVYLLVQEVEPLVKSGHRLLSLQRKQSSSIQILVTDQQHKTFEAAFLVADESGFIHQKSRDRPASEYSFKASARARQLRRTFQTMWEKGSTDPDLIQVRV